ncbi:MAG: hypothetical protein F4X97_02325 [Boseongicola sp. SB0662_bin_57]|nr:hypothetical protein [Boseongicola sp. SB0662_bin_57]
MEHILKRALAALPFVAMLTACSDTPRKALESGSAFSPETVAALESLGELGETVRALGIDEEFFASLEDADWFEDVAAADVADRYAEIAAAFHDPCIGDECGPEDALRYGAWLAFDADGELVAGAAVEARGLPPGYATVWVAPSASATYIGNAKGVGHWNDRADPDVVAYHAGEFTARVVLDYDLDAGRLVGRVGGWTGPGADARWPDLGLGALGGDGTGRTFTMLDGSITSGVVGAWAAVPYGGAGSYVLDGSAVVGPITVEQPPGYVGTFNAAFASGSTSFGDGEVVAGFDAIAATQK